MNEAKINLIHHFNNILYCLQVLDEAEDTSRANGWKNVSLSYDKKQAFTYTLTYHIQEIINEVERSQVNDLLIDKPLTFTEKVKQQIALLDGAKFQHRVYQYPKGLCTREEFLKARDKFLP
jgi:hypothetical protein